MPLAGGRLSALADVQFRAGWLLLVALATQVLAFAVLPPGALGELDPFAHLGSYVLAGLFLVANRSLPGLWLIGLGGFMNFLAIAANGGTMPALPSALATAGLEPGAPGQTNSAVVAEPHLAALGDVLAVPAAWPFSNVFSLGDVCIALGGGLALHRISGSRLLPSGSGQFAALRQRPDFIRLWLAQVVSNLGDFVYALAVVVSVAGQGGDAATLATLLIAQVAPAAVAGVLGGPLLDRFSRRGIMIGADLLRALAVASLLVPGDPSLTHLYAVAGMLGVFGALFQPSLQASLPNLVPREQLVAANSLVSGTYHVGVVLGPVLGALLAARLGAGPAFALNAASFVLSAALIVTVRLRRPAAGAGAASQGAVSLGAVRRELAEGLRHVLATRLVRGLIAVTALVMLASAIRTPMEPLFILRTLEGRPEALGLAEGVWGLGMVLGVVAAPAAARRWSRRRLLPVTVAIVGACVLAASQSAVLAPVLIFWLFSGAANAIGAVSYESLLQERTPDRLRGRVLAASEAMLDASLLAGYALAGWLGSAMGVRAAYAVSGLLLLATAVLSVRLLGGAAEGDEHAALPGERDDTCGRVEQGEAALGAPVP